MKLSDLNIKFENLENDPKKTILEIIDIKTESDMKEVISAINNLETNMDAEFHKMDAKFQTIESELKYLKWFILITIGTLVALSKLSIF